MKTPSFTTYKRLGKTVKRRLLTDEEKAQKKTKFKRAMAKHWTKGRARTEVVTESQPIPSRRVSNAIASVGDDFLVESEQDIIQQIRKGELTQLDPIHKRILVTLYTRQLTQAS